MSYSPKQTTLREIYKHLASSHLGLTQTNAQLRSAARRLYDKYKLPRIVPTKPVKFHWENNNANTPTSD